MPAFVTVASPASGCPVYVPATLLRLATVAVIASVAPIDVIVSASLASARRRVAIPLVVA